MYRATINAGADCVMGPSDFYLFFPQPHFKQNSDLNERNKNIGSKLAEKFGHKFYTQSHRKDYATLQ